MGLYKYADPLMSGGLQLQGSYIIAPSAVDMDVIAARTTTAGFIFTMRFDPTDTNKKALIRYVGVRMVTTTAFPTPQEIGCDLIVARSYTVDCTDGTAVDVGSTLTGSGKLLSGFALSGFAGDSGNVRVAGANAITAGTHTLDAQPLGVVSGWTGGVGDAVDGGPGQYATLFDARSEWRHPLVLGNDEGIVIRNLILMGATGVVRADFRVEWDEGIPIA
jgi:hypothetical protein